VCFDYEPDRGKPFDGVRNFHRRALPNGMTPNGGSSYRRDKLGSVVEEDVEEVSSSSAGGTEKDPERQGANGPW
jgi:hypothetical protein